MSKGTPRRSVRIPDETWDAALDLANERGDKLSDIMREALDVYVEKERAKLSKYPERSANTPPCPHCGTPIEAYTVDAAYIHTDAYTGNHAIIVGRERKPDGLTSAKIKRVKDMDRITLDPCGDEISYAELDVLRAEVGA